MANIAIHFSDFFDLKNNELKQYGAFDVSLTFDIPVFIDPFRLYASDKKEYNELHERIVGYLRFLRDYCSDNSSISNGQLRDYFLFPEVRNIFMGFCKTSNSGRGLGMKFAKALKNNLREILTDFGDEAVSDSSHLEKLCIICNDVGRDCISDFTANLIKDYLAEYTQTFARLHLKPEQCCEFDVQRAVFDYEKQIWKSRKYYLPKWNSGYVLLVPTDLLTKDDTWISKKGLLESIMHLPDTVGNEVLKDRLVRLIAEVVNERKRYKTKEINEKFRAFWQSNPEIVDWYIKQQEDNKATAMEVLDARVAETERLFIESVKAAAQKLALLGFYEIPVSSIEEARMRIQYFKHFIEDQDGYKLFYLNEKKKISESQLQLAFRLVWFGTDKDVNREPNNGRGPVDYKVSKGCFDQCLIEFKLASNSKLEENLQNQLKVYKAANGTEAGICIIAYTNDKERLHMEGILRKLGLIDSPNVITIDASPDKISASKVGVKTAKRC